MESFSGRCCSLSQGDRIVLMVRGARVSRPGGPARVHPWNRSPGIGARCLVTRGKDPSSPPFEERFTGSRAGEFSTNPPFSPGPPLDFGLSEPRLLVQTPSGKPSRHTTPPRSLQRPDSQAPNIRAGPCFPSLPRHKRQGRREAPGRETDIAVSSSELLGGLPELPDEPRVGLVERLAGGLDRKSTRRNSPTNQE